MRRLSRRQSLPRHGGCPRALPAAPWPPCGLQLVDAVVPSVHLAGACCPGWRRGGRAARRVPREHYLTSCGTPRGRSATGAARPQLKHLALDRKFLLRGDSQRRVKEAQRRQCSGSVVARHRCLKVWASGGASVEEPPTACDVRYPGREDVYHELDWAGALKDLLQREVVCSLARQRASVTPSAARSVRGLVDKRQRIWCATMGPIAVMCAAAPSSCAP